MSIAKEITGLPPIEWCDYWKAGNNTFIEDERSCDEHTREDLAEAAEFIRELLAENAKLKIERRDAFRTGYHAGHADTVVGNFSWCHQGSTEVADEWYEETYGESPE